MNLLISTSIVVLAFVASVSADELIIKASKVYTAAGDPLAPGAVHIRDGKIVEVAAKIVLPAGAKEIDLGDGVLIPGLIDAHTSIGVEGGLSESTLEVTPNFRVLDAVDMSSRAFRQARADGTSTVCLVPGTENVISGVSSIIKTSGERAKRIVKPDHALVITLSSDPASGNSSRNRPDSIYVRQPTNRMGVVWILRDEFNRARAANGKNGVLAEVIAGKRPIVCVSRADVDMTAALRLRHDFPMSLAIAGGQEAYKVKAELASAKVPVMLGPMTGAVGPGPEQTELVLNLAGTLHEAGVPFVLTGGKLLDQARMAARFGLPKNIALASITAAPAKFLGLESRLGTIAVGRDADFVALSGEPFDLTSKVRWTMIDGVMHAEPQ